MDPLAQALKSSQKSQPQHQVSQLDKGFETEQALSQTQPQPTEGLNPLAAALSQSGAGINKGEKSPLDQNQLSQDELLRQQQEAEKQAKKEALRKQLHEKVNPLELHDVYSQREAQTKQQLEQTRAALKSMIGEVKQFHKEVDITVYSNIVDQGQTGVGLKIFFEKLRTWIEFLRQQVHSARTWLQQSQAKSKKRAAHRGGRMGAGIEIGGNQHEQTKAIFDQMHHETSTAYSGV